MFPNQDRTQTPPYYAPSNYQNPMQHARSDTAIPYQYPIGQPYPHNNIFSASVGNTNPYIQGQILPLPEVSIVTTKSGFEKLDAKDGIFIKQKIEPLEIITCCETENKFYIYSLTKQGDKKGKKIFKCKEKSSFCVRCCCSGECRPFKVVISHCDENDESDGEPFLKIERPCACTCLCLNRPEIRITCVENGKDEFLGKVTHPFSWNCSINMSVFDDRSQQKFNIHGNCCQLGLWCRCPCALCQNINFTIRTPDGSELSRLYKRSNGCLKQTIADADQFVLFFPSNCTSQDKALLMCAVLFMDFRYFELNPHESG